MGFDAELFTSMSILVPLERPGGTTDPLAPAVAVEGGRTCKVAGRTIDCPVTALLSTEPRGVLGIEEESTSTRLEATRWGKKIECAT